MYWNTDVWQEMNRLRREMDGLLSQYDRTSASTTYPLVNVYESTDELQVTAELPGMTKDSVSITFSDGVLGISGKRKQPGQVKKMAALRQERSQGDFEKTLRIPSKIDTSTISASFTNGILTVTLPKAEEAKPKTITIDAQ